MDCIDHGRKESDTTARLSLHFTIRSAALVNTLTKTIPKKKKRKKTKWLSEEALQIAEKRREPKHKIEKERYT